MTPPPAPDRSTRDGDAGARIAQQLRDRILLGDYPPGTRILQTELAERFGASRVPVREALRMLESEGLVRLVANAGAWVSQLTLAECEEIYQMRERLEPLLLRYAIPTLATEHLDHLAKLAATMERGAEVEEFLRLDREFHLSTYAGADTAQLGELVAKLWNTTQPYRRAYTRLADPEARRIIHDEHHLLVAALRDGDAAEAEIVLATHIRRTRRQLARHPDLFHDEEMP